MTSGPLQTQPMCHWALGWKSNKSKDQCLTSQQRCITRVGNIQSIRGHWGIWRCGSVHKIGWTHRGRRCGWWWSYWVVEYRLADTLTCAWNLTKITTHTCTTTVKTSNNSFRTSKMSMIYSYLSCQVVVHHEKGHNLVKDRLWTLILASIMSYLSELFTLKRSRI